MNTMQRRVAFDLDGTICTETHGEYALAQPIGDRVLEIRKRYAAGEYVIIDSARGSQTGVDWLESTTYQLRQWGVPFHELHVGRKPFAHEYVDDRGKRPEEFFAQNGKAERWPDSYYAKRHGNDFRRMLAFGNEFLFLSRHNAHRNLHTVCDVGCSTGEFLESLCYIGDTFGMEISEHAKAIAMTKGLRFDRDITTETNFFDTVILRGMLQHLPEPCRTLQQSFRALKPGGHLAILATPNTDSWCYRLLGDFPPPLNDAPRNYWFPSSKQLQNALTNYGFEIVAVEYPYWGGPYARPLHDAISFTRRLLGGPWVPFSFPGNMMNVLVRKP